MQQQPLCWSHFCLRPELLHPALGATQTRTDWYHHMTVRYNHGKEGITIKHLPEVWQGKPQDTEVSHSSITLTDFRRLIEDDYPSLLSPSAWITTIQQQGNTHLHVCTSPHAGFQSPEFTGPKAACSHGLTMTCHFQNRDLQKEKRKKERKKEENKTPAKSSPSRAVPSPTSTAAPRLPSHRKHPQRATLGRASRVLVTFLISPALLLFRGCEIDEFGSLGAGLALRK